MLRLPHPLYFPKLSFQGKVSFETKGVANVEKPSYTLDWGGIDSLRQDEFYAWSKTNWPNKDLKYVGTLPPKYDSWVRGLMFVISKDYMDEIKRCSRMALLQVFLSSYWLV